MVKGYQKFVCGLVGKNVAYSFSPMVHASFADYTYRVYSVEENELERIVRKTPYVGLNVTTPYEEQVIPLLDNLTEIAEKIGAVNTIYRRNQKLIGDNTDYEGFCYLLKEKKVDVTGKKVVICGCGGAAKAVKFACLDRGASFVDMIPCKEKGEDLSPYTDADILINATPIGASSRGTETPIENLKLFHKLEWVISLNYNPIREKLLQDAEEQGIKTSNGVYMLVYQAKSSVEKFLQVAIDDNAMPQAVENIEARIRNIVLVGMPGSGKSTIGRKLAYALHVPFYDTDEEVLRRTGRTPEEIIEQDGDERFREIEHEAVVALSSKRGIVLATGGGVVTYADNKPYLKMNGYIFFLNRDLNNLTKRGRRLALDRDVVGIYNKRKQQYHDFADYQIEVTESKMDTVQSIIERFGL